MREEEAQWVGIYEAKIEEEDPKSCPGISLRGDQKGSAPSILFEIFFGFSLKWPSFWIDPDLMKITAHLDQRLELNTFMG